VRSAARRIRVSAITDEEVEGVLRRLGPHDDAADGRARCFICGARVNLGNLGEVRNYLKTLNVSQDNVIPARMRKDNRELKRRLYRLGHYLDKDR